MGAVFGVDPTGKARAVTHVNATLPALIGHRVSEHRNRKRMKAGFTRRGFQQPRLAVVAERRHGVRLAPGRCKRVERIITCYANFPLGLFVIRFQVLVAYGPVLQGRVGHLAVGGLHGEVFYHEPPRHGPIGYRAGTHAGGDIAIGPFVGVNDALGAVAVHRDASVTRGIWSKEWREWEVSLCRSEE